MKFAASVVLRDNEHMTGCSNKDDDRFAPRPASGALTKTGGFLTGFTHTLQPYIGCRFGCEYCYVKALSVHRFHTSSADWGEYAHPRVGIAERLRAELKNIEGRGSLRQLSIFMSSSTDPYQGLERHWRLTRACLDVFADYPPGLLIVQTRSPLVEDDFAALTASWLKLLAQFHARDRFRRRKESCYAGVPLYFTPPVYATYRTKVWT